MPEQQQLPQQKSTTNILDKHIIPTTLQMRSVDNRLENRNYVRTPMMSGSKISKNNYADNNSERQKSQASHASHTSHASQISHAPSRISRMIMKDQENQVNSQRQKILELERERVQAQKEIRALKYELETNSMRNSSISDSQDQIMAAKNQSRIESLEDQVEKYRNKTSQYQQDGHRKKLKIQQLQKSLKSISQKNDQLQQQIKVHQSQKQSLLTKTKQLQQEHRELKQRHEDQSLVHENYVKRSQYKENVYKEQLKTINQKYTLAESQRQKLLFQRAELVSQGEQRDKMERDGWRVRERGLQEEKNRMVRKVDMLEKQLLGHLEQQKGFENTLAETERNLKNTKLMLEAKDVELENFEKLVAEKQFMLDRQTNARKNLQADVQKMSRLQQQTQFLKKQLSQKQQQLLQLTKSTQSLQQSKRSLTQKNEQLQTKLKFLQTSSRGQQKDNETLQKQLASLKKSEQQKTKKLTQLTETKQSQQNRAYALSDEIKEIQRKSKAREAELVRDMQNFRNRISQLEEENQEVSEKCGNLEAEAEAVAKEFGEMRANYSQKLMHVETLEKQLSEQFQLVHKYELDLQDLDHRNTELQQKYNKKLQKSTTRIYQLQEKLSQSQSQLFNTTKTQEQTTTRLSSQLRTVQQQLRNKEKQVQQLKKTVNQCESFNTTLNEEVERASVEIKHRMKEINGLKDAVQVLKSQKLELEDARRVLEQENQACKRELLGYEMSMLEKGKEKEQLNGQTKKMKKQLQKFKTNNQYSMKTFFNLINQQQLPQVINLVHEDAELLKGMQEVIKRKKTANLEQDKMLNQLQSMNSELKAQVDFLTNQGISKDGDIFRLTATITELERDRNEIDSNGIKTKSGLQQRIREKDKQIQNLQQHLLQLQTGNTNLTKIIHIKQQQLDKLLTQINICKQSCQAAQQQLVKEREAHEETINKMLGTTKNTIDELQAEIKLVKINLQTQVTKRKMANITNQQYEARIVQLQDEIQGIKKEVDNYKGDVDRLRREIQQANQVIQAQEAELAQLEAHHNSKVSQLDFSYSENTKVSEKYTNLENANMQLQDKVRNLEQKMVQMGNIIREKDEQNEEIKKKLQAEVIKSGKQIENERKAKNSLDEKLKQVLTKLNQTEALLTTANQEIESMRKKINVISNQNMGETQKIMREQEALAKKYEKLSEDKQLKIDQLILELNQVMEQRDFHEANSQTLQKSLEQILTQRKNKQDNLTKQIVSLQKQKIALNSDLYSSQQQLKNIQTSLMQVSRNFQIFQLQNRTKVDYIDPITSRLNKLVEETRDYVQFMGQFEASKNKIIKISNHKLENYGERNMGELVREINIAAQKCKVQIINKSKISQEDKKAIAEEFKTLQTCIEKIIRF